MKLQDIEKKFPPFDKPAGEAAYLLSTKKFVKYEMPYNAPVPDLKWFAQPGDPIDDTQWPPFIGYSCGTCGSKGRFAGPNATAQVVRHCMVAETCPDTVSVEYSKLRTAHLARHKKKTEAAKSIRPKRDANGFIDPRSATDIIRDNVIAAALGMKSPEVLRQEALKVAELAARMT